MRDYSAVTSFRKSDIDKLLDQDADAFDALLYIPDMTTKELVTDAVDVVGNLEGDERNVSYGEPVSVRVKFVTPLPYSGASLGVIDASNDINEAGIEEEMQMLISYPDVPKFAVVEYDEFADTGVKEVALYVSGINTIGNPMTGKIYSVRPLPDGKDLYVINEG